MATIAAISAFKYLLVVILHFGGVGLLYSDILFYRHRHEPYFIKRGTTLVMIEIALLTCICNIIIPFCVYLRLLGYFPQIDFHTFLPAALPIVCGFIDIMAIRICYYYSQFVRVQSANKQNSST